jgi:hypothetical protein
MADDSPPPLTRISALLASGPGAPDGDIHQGLDLHASLTPDGHVSLDAYYADPRPWRARRFRPDRPDWQGELVREEETWALRGAPEEDGPLWFLDARTLHPGNYITLHRPDGASLIYRVVSVAAAEEPDPA